MNIIVEGANRKGLFVSSDVDMYRTCGRVIQKYHDNTDKESINDNYRVAGAFCLGYKLALSEFNNDKMSKLVHSLTSDSVQDDKRVRWFQYQRRLSETLDLPPSFLMDCDTPYEIMSALFKLRNGLVLTKMIENDNAYEIYDHNTFDQYQHSVSKKIVKKLMSTPLFDLIMNVDDEWVDNNLPTTNKFGKQNYSHAMDGKQYISFDIVKGSATAFFYMLPYVFGIGNEKAFGNLSDELFDPESGHHAWDLLIRSCTDSEVLIGSKKFRQIAFGTMLNCKNNNGIWLKDIINRSMSAILDDIMEIIPNDMGTPIVRMLDEIIFDSSNTNDMVIKEMKDGMAEMNPIWLSTYVRTDVYDLRSLKLSDGKKFYVKTFINSDKTVEIKGLEKSYHRDAYDTYIKDIVDSTLAIKKYSSIIKDSSVKDYNKDYNKDNTDTIITIVDEDSSSDD